MVTDSCVVGECRELITGTGADSCPPLTSQSAIHYESQIMKMLKRSAALFVAVLLSGCPETKLPQVPPSVPQPKVAGAWLMPVMVAAADADADAAAITQSVA